MKNKSGLEEKFMKLDVKLLGNPDDTSATEFEFEAVATTFGNEDRQGDVIVSGAFDEGLLEVGPKLLWQHNASEPLGTITDIRATDQEITFKGKMPKSDTFVSDRVMPQLRHGSLDISIGFMAKEVEFENGVRLIVKGTIFEISLVTIPANPKAVVTNVKAAKMKDLPIADISTDWSAEGAADRIDDLDQKSAKDMPKGWIGYPVVDVIDGVVSIVPKALFSVSASIQCKNLNDDNAGVVDFIEYQYERMGRESPFEKGFSPAELETLTPKEMVKFLRTRPLLSKSGAKFFTEVIYKAGSEKAGEQDADGLRHLEETLKNISKGSSK